VEQRPGPDLADMAGAGGSAVNLDVVAGGVLNALNIQAAASRKVEGLVACRVTGVRLTIRIRGDRARRVFLDEERKEDRRRRRLRPRGLDELVVPVDGGVCGRPGGSRWVLRSRVQSEGERAVATEHAVGVAAAALIEHQGNAIRARTVTADQTAIHRHT